MIKLLPALVLGLLLFDCGKNKPRPPLPRPTPVPTVEPSPIPSPIVEPSPSPVPTPSRPTPYPTPVVDLAPYLREQGGRVVTVDTSSAEDVGQLINAADNFDGPGKLVISGGGKLKTQVVLKHDSEWTGEYFCDANTLEGQILLHDNTKTEGKDAVFLEPTAFSGTPAITVFQTYASAKNNYASAQNVTVKGMKILGRQERTDGGVRQSISFGNCKSCAAIDNDLSGVASIGIQFGGGAAQGNHAENVLAYRNKLRRFAAAAIALVNVKGALVAENDIRDPGRKRGEPGGISGIDIESNDTDDCVKDIKIFNNYIGYGQGASHSIGNGILGQNVYGTPCSGGLLVANNVIDGWEGRNGLENSNLWGLSGGLYFVGQWHDGLVVSNIVIRALQPAISCYGCRGLEVRDTWLVSSGGGGMGAVYLEGSIGNTFQLRIFDDPNITPGSTGWWIQCDETSGVNTFRTEAKLVGCKTQEQEHHEDEAMPHVGSTSKPLLEDGRVQIGIGFLFWLIILWRDRRAMSIT